jgi:hypothetical protein
MINVDTVGSPPVPGVAGTNLATVSGSVLVRKGRFGLRTFYPTLTHA